MTFTISDQKHISVKLDTPVAYLPDICLITGETSGRGQINICKQILRELIVIVHVQTYQTIEKRGFNSQIQLLCLLPRQIRITHSKHICPVPILVVLLSKIPISGQCLIRTEILGPDSTIREAKTK